jgi:hypothetical protein
MAALPFVFLTNESHVISSVTLQSGQQPQSIQITKHYYKPHIEEIKKEFENVKSLGSATAEEWLKGLEGRGKELRDDSSRWERWEAAGGLLKMLEAVSDRTNPNTTSLNMAPPINDNSPIIYNGVSSVPPPPHVLTNAASHLLQPIHNAFGKPMGQLVVGESLKDACTNKWTQAAAMPPSRFESTSQSGFHSFPSRLHMQAKHERTKEEVSELKAARKAEIERRCLLLTPPLAAGVLAHMASFQASIQIIQPLTDSAWEVLKPRLLSQREEAEQRENDRIAQTRVVQERSDERRYQDVEAKGDPKDLVDREWDDIQAPLRSRIGGYADEIIRDGWNGGEKVSPESSPLFAAEVLIYVRKRFYAEVAKDEAAVRATGREPEMDPPSGPYTRRLTLENMKWVFDTKIKPHTEQYRKELFLCNACDYASKYYGFEGVIQHYAAKHTSALSAGSVVVHWKSEWPEYPPFNPDPTATTVNSYYPAAPSASASYAGGNGQSMPQNYGYGGYQAPPISAVMNTPNPHVYQESPGPYYGHPQFGEQYLGPQNGPYPPPTQAYPDSSQGYHAPQYSVAPAGPIISGYHDAPHDYNQQNFEGSYPSQPQSMYTSPHVGTGYPSTGVDAAGQQPLYGQHTAHYGQPYNQPLSYVTDNFPQVPERSGEYTAQLQDLARNAREIWNSIGSLKEVPGSVKVYTIIYHVLARFQATFQDDPPLSMMVDGLSNNKDMRPVRNVNGLLCKACSLGMAGSNSAPHKKHFSFPQLVNHFHSLHEQSLSQANTGHLPDWKTDMVLLPELPKLTSIVNAPGMDDKKLKLFSEALPEIIPVPAATIVNYHDESSQHFGAPSDPARYSQLAPSQDNHEKYYTTTENGKPSEAGSIAYDSGEYDPRHPAELPMASQSQRRKSRQFEQPNPGVGKDTHQYPRHEDQHYPQGYQEQPSRSYVEESSSRAIPIDEYGQITLPGGRRVYTEEPLRYRETSDIVEYRVRREPRIMEFKEPNRVSSNHRGSSSRPYQNNAAELATETALRHAVRDQYTQQTNDTATQQNRIYDVVAQISQQAQQARDQMPIKNEAAEAGSEDGEVRVKNAKPDLGHKPLSNEASNAAERFLNEFRPGDNSNDATRVSQEAVGMGHIWQSDPPDSKRVYRRSIEPHRSVRAVYEDNEHAFGSSRRIDSAQQDGINDEYYNQERPPLPRQPRNYAYDERYAGSAGEQSSHRDRSPELVDRRFKLNNVVYRDERQSINGTHRTPSRYARYESVRLENDRARSKSPLYVKIGPQSGQYRERSPVAHPLRQEPIYRTRTPPQHPQDGSYERSGRQDYVRIYPDEYRPRETQYPAEAFELIRVSDPQGDYMIRRPVRRDVESVYTSYEDGVYTRPPIYETRGPPITRAEPTFIEEEEYDPRRPAAVVPLQYQ